MKKTLKRICSVITALLLVFTMFDLSGIKAHADSSGLEIVFAGNLSGDQITYSVGSTNVVFTVNSGSAGDKWVSGSKTLKVSDEKSAFIADLNSYLSLTGLSSSMKIKLSENYPNTNEGFKCYLNYSESLFTGITADGTPRGKIYLSVIMEPVEATINATGITTYQQNVNDPEFVAFSFGINDVERTNMPNNINHKRGSSTESYSTTCTYTPVGDNLDFVVRVLNPLALPKSVVINNITYNKDNTTGFPTYETLANYLVPEENAYKFTISGVLKADNNVYNITYTSELMSSKNAVVGNFGWIKDSAKIKDPKDMDDLIDATQGKIEFISAIIGNDTYTSPAALMQAKPNFKWTEDEWHGETLLPVGTVLTVKLVPVAGNQLSSFLLNGFDFTPGDEIGYYTFTVEGGNFHLQAKFDKAENVVTRHAGVSSGTVNVSKNDMGIGTAKLTLSDASDADKDILRNAAPDSEYTVTEFMDLTLSNVVEKFKNSVKQDDPWTRTLNNLSEPVNITLSLIDAIGSDVVILHEKDDKTVETISATYDSNTKTVSFATTSFSNYAIAYKGAVSGGSGGGTSYYSGGGSGSSGDNSDSNTSGPSVSNGPSTPAERYEAKIDTVTETINEIAENPSAFTANLEVGETLSLGGGTTVSAVTNDDGSVQTVINFSSGDSLPSNIMDSMKESEDTTLIFSYSYEGVDYKIEITSEEAAEFFDPSIKWYGPKYLYSLFSDEAREARKAAKEAATVKTYVIKSGDSLNAIAEALGTTVEALVSKNDIADPNRIFAGQEIRY
ncbi:MAG: LysM peptidoglycan-binding domain-containing protein [Lachnospiraceae bacterium]|nr:LysM peptidoglycan-binding domain-containing protein [Lachnospiraceae bacterium]